jgi:hypothetical protein
MRQQVLWFCGVLSPSQALMPRQKQESPQAWPCCLAVGGAQFQAMSRVV